MARHTRRKKRRQRGWEGMTPGWCGVAWDTLMCWNVTQPGTFAVVPCPYYIHGFNTDGYICIYLYPGARGCGVLCKASPQQGDLRLSGLQSGQDAGGGARTCDRGSQQISWRASYPLCHQSPLVRKDMHIKIPTYARAHTHTHTQSRSSVNRGNQKKSLQYQFRFLPRETLSAKYAERYCTPNGTWWVNPDVNSTSVGWTNYTRCMLPDKDLTSHVTLANKLVLLYTVGYSISLASLVVAVIIMLCWRRLHSKSNTLHLNLFLAFILRASMSFMKDRLFVGGLGLPQDVQQAADSKLHFLHEGS
ncbi:parathyroid hormone/parathyroid hormone-related peptide receptor, partial [Plakobranchus ocellatus]